MRGISAILAVAFAGFFPAAVEACTGVNFHTGRRQSVQVIYRTKANHPDRYFAEATHNPKSGRPVIIYYRRYARAPAFFRRFVARHECCHHSIERAGGNAGDEVAANCCALRGMSKSARAAVGRYIVSRGVNSNAMFNYAGVGEEFWRGTVARCPDLAK
ncbi:MAG: hypothetical protein ACE5FM_01025 [Methyloligellaceae bacterium]